MDKHCEVSRLSGEGLGGVSGDDVAGDCVGKINSLRMAVNSMWIIAENRLFHLIFDNSKSTLTV